MLDSYAHFKNSPNSSATKTVKVPAVIALSSIFLVANPFLYVSSREVNAFPCGVAAQFTKKSSE